MSEITAKDVIDWQNAMRSQKGKTGKPVSPTYLKTIHGQLSSIFNHAIRYYDFGNVELSEAEMQTLIWLVKRAENTVANVVSAIRKAMTSDASGGNCSPRP